MVGEYWTGEEKRKLKAMTISHVITSPKRLKEMIEYFRTPGASLWAVTEGDGPFHVSKELGRKIRNYVDDDALDWVMGETPSRSTENFDAEWQGWRLFHAAEFSEAVSAYRGQLNNQIQTCEIHLGLRATFMPPKVAYGPKHQPFVESIFSRDRVLANQRTEFESALKAGDLARAMKQRETIESKLIKQIAI